MSVHLLLRPMPKVDHGLEIWHTNGLGDTFDPRVDWDGDYNGYWVMSDGSIISATSGVEINYNPSTSGPHRAIFRGVPLRHITYVSCSDDKAYLPRGLYDLPTGLITASLYNCPLLTGSLSDLPNGLTYASFGDCSLLTGSLSDLPAGLTTAYFYGCPLLTGSLSDLPGGLTYASFGNCSSLTGSLSDLPGGLTYAYFYGCPLLTGSLSDLPGGLTTAHFGDCSLLTGSLSDLPGGLTYTSFSNCSLLTGPLSDLPSGLTTAYLYGCPLLSGDSIGHLTNISVIRIQDCDFDQSEVDAILEDMYTNRANFTNATPDLNIGGSNAAPSGVYQDATPPTTGKEYIYKLVNDPDAEGFNKWAITYTA